MKTLPINFIKPVWQITATSIIALLTATLFGMVTFWCATTQNKIKAQLQKETAVLSRPKAELITKKTISSSEANAISRSVYALNVPWDLILDTLQKSTPENIALLSLEMDNQQPVLHATAEAANYESMLAYIHALQQKPLFSKVSISQHVVQEQDMNKPLRFSMDIYWSRA